MISVDPREEPHAMNQAQDPLLPPPAASGYLAAAGVRHAPSTLNNMRSSGGGPEFVRLGRWIFYSRSALDKYVRGLSSPPLRSTHEPAGSEAAA
jgi:hypothetical protein